MVGLLDGALPRTALDGTTEPSGPAAALYLWAYGSSVLAHVVFFDRPGSALVGGIGMGALALPFARALWSTASVPALSAARRRRIAPDRAAPRGPAPNQSA